MCYEKRSPIRSDAINNKNNDEKWTARVNGLAVAGLGDTNLCSTRIFKRKLRMIMTVIGFRWERRRRWRWKMDDSVKRTAARMCEWRKYFPKAKCLCNGEAIEKLPTAKNEYTDDGSREGYKAVSVHRLLPSEQKCRVPYRNRIVWLSLASGTALVV